MEQNTTVSHTRRFYNPEKTRGIPLKQVKIQLSLCNFSKAIFFIKVFLPILSLFTMNMCLGENFKRIEVPLNHGWKFYKGNPDDAFQINFDDSNWESVCLPHTWNNLNGQDGGGNYDNVKLKVAF
ncbi:MAG: hypothetical protein ACP5MI_10300 [Candidatus Kryptoniota bacterium]